MLYFTIPLLIPLLSQISTQSFAYTDKGKFDFSVYTPALVPHTTFSHFATAWYLANRTH